MQFLKKRLKDNLKTILITGSTKGIGRATAIAAAKQGWTVILHGRNEECLQQLQQELQIDYSASTYYVMYDVRDTAEIKKAFLWIKKNVGPLDALVNNAGIMDDALLGMLKPEQVTQTFDVNTYAAIYHMQYASRLMTKNKKGAIINVSSIMGRFGNAGQVAYSASKAALIGATQSAAKELAPLNIRVNAVAPGFIETDLTNNLPEEIIEEKLATIKMKRAGKAEEVANVILFLASDAASYVTGQIIGVDGGMVI